MKNDNFKHLHGFISKEEYKSSLPDKLSSEEIGFLVRLIMSDATMYKTKTKGCYIKVEQSFKQKDFVYYIHSFLAK